MPPLFKLKLQTAGTAGCFTQDRILVPHDGGIQPGQSGRNGEGSIPAFFVLIGIVIEGKDARHFDAVHEPLERKLVVADVAVDKVV